MRTVVVINRQARRLRERPSIMFEVMELCGEQAIVLSTGTAIEMRSELDLIMREGGIDRLYLVGGDGTFSLALNWVMGLDREDRPAIGCVGGGEICYMARYLRMPSSDPVVNLRHLLGNRGDDVSEVVWKPLEIRDPDVGVRWYAAIFATGIVYDFIERYEREGKGSILRVLWMLTSLALQVLNPLWDRPMPLAHATRVVSYEKNRDQRQTIGSEVVSTIPEPQPWGCRPFRTHNPHLREQAETFLCLSYWGMLRPLAFALPSIWFGYEPFWIRGKVFNYPLTSMRIQLMGHRVILDGDRLTRQHPLWVRSIGAELNLWIALGPKTTLLTYDP